MFFRIMLIWHQRYFIFYDVTRRSKFDLCSSDFNFVSSFVPVNALFCIRTGFQKIDDPFSRMPLFSPSSPRLDDSACNCNFDGLLSFSGTSTSDALCDQMSVREKESSFWTYCNSAFQSSFLPSQFLNTIFLNCITFLELKNNSNFGHLIFVITKVIHNYESIIFIIKHI